MKQQRPDIPKLDILTVGDFNSDGSIGKGWKFDGESHPQSVGEYLSDDWHLIGGYTLDELKTIKNS